MVEKSHFTQELFRLATALIVKAQSMTGLLGKFHRFHPDWPNLEDLALSSLGGKDAKLAATLKKAMIRLSKVEGKMSEAELERKRAKDALDAAEEAIADLNGKGAEGNADKAILKSQSSKLEKEAAKARTRLHKAESEAKRATGLWAKKRDEVHKLALRVTPATNQAEKKVIEERLREDSLELVELRDAFKPLFEEHKLVLARPAGQPDPTLGSWTGTSMCDVLLQIVEGAIGAVSQGGSVRVRDELHGLNRDHWRQLDNIVCREIAELAKATASRRGKQEKPLPGNNGGLSGKAFDYVQKLRQRGQAMSAAALVAEGGGNEASCRRTMNKLVGHQLHDGMSVAVRKGRPNLYEVVKSKNT